jgi:Domain of unknown function (DUF4166)
VTGVSPFVHALGGALDRLAPAVREHLLQPAGASLFAGRLRRSWRRGGPIGWLLAKILRVDFRAIEPQAPFELRNALLEGDAMLWRRTLLGARTTIDNVGVMRWDAASRALVDTIGRGGAIEVELVPGVEGAGLKLTSRGQWLRILGVRIPLPRWVAGSAVVREREEPGGGITLALALRHPWLGEYAGYEAELEGVRGQP